MPHRFLRCRLQTPFPPARVIIGGVNILLALYLPFYMHLVSIWFNQATCGISTSYAAFVDLFECTRNFPQRLHIDTETTFTTVMTDFIRKMVVEGLSLPGLASKPIKEEVFGRAGSRVC
jgi:hypothetical protein